MSSETMYDRLGDLLSKTLETGFVKTAAPGKKVKDGARKKNTEQKLRSAAEQNQTATRRENTANRRENTSTRRENTANRRENTATHENRQSFVYHSAVKKITPELARAYRLLGITFSATTEDVKKAYKEKIKYYHPDRHTVNAVMQKIATDKTRQVVEAFTLIMKFLEQ
ncbi:J domain-containing protein [Treponema peruense]|uniref:J domain-containing protein n=1 Tax=Treponema peruense TaxID=2787628 RepID=A0A7T3V442_9SPIR|nr:J domain-containing protein [Treponema peruense]QQA00101.1 J domain-containing protein [Treponema peruense]